MTGIVFPSGWSMLTLSCLHVNKVIKGCLVLCYNCHCTWRLLTFLFFTWWKTMKESVFRDRLHVGFKIGIFFKLILCNYWNWIFPFKILFWGDNPKKKKKRKTNCTFQIFNSLDQPRYFENLLFFIHFFDFAHC